MLTEEPRIAACSRDEADTQFLTALTWSLDADDRLVAAAAEGRRRRFIRRLAKAALPPRLRLPRGVASPCEQALWQLPPAEASAVDHLTRETLQAVVDKSWQDALHNSAAALLDSAEMLPELPPDVLAAWLTILGAVGRRLEHGTLWRFWRRTWVETRRFVAAAIPAEADPLSPTAELRDEILWRAGSVFAPLAEAGEWQAQARDSWRTRLASADEETALPLLAGDALLAWLAALVRITTDAAACEATLWRKRELIQLRRMDVRLSATLLQDGALTGACESRFAVPLLRSLGQLASIEEQHPARRLVRAIDRGRVVDRRRGRVRKSDRPGYQSDAAQLAVLRNHWGTTAAVVHVDYTNQAARLDVSIAGERLLRGRWDSRVLLGGYPAITQDWKCECWFSDADADFIELSTPLGGGVSLLRQICLAREEELLVMAEAVRGAEPELPVELTSTLLVPANLQVDVDGLTRELQFPLPSRRVRLFPVHLPWERAAAIAGTCYATDDGLQTHIRGLGAQCQVLVWEWSNPTAGEAADGGPLTVAEDLRRLPARDACAARLRVGDRQWLYLHNLSRGAMPRSVLGLHTDSETVIGRLSAAGHVEHLVHVESPALDADSAENPTANAHSA